MSRLNVFAFALVVTQLIVMTLAFASWSGVPLTSLWVGAELVADVCRRAHWECWLGTYVAVCWFGIGPPMSRSSMRRDAEKGDYPVDHLPYYVATFFLPVIVPIAVVCAVCDLIFVPKKFRSPMW